MSSNSRRTFSSRRPGACSAAFAWRCARRSDAILISPVPRPWSRREKQSTRIRTIPICRRCAQNTGNVSSTTAAKVSPVSKRVPCICLWRNCRPPQTARLSGRKNDFWKGFVLMLKCITSKCRTTTISIDVPPPVFSRKSTSLDLDIIIYRLARIPMIIKYHMFEE